MVNTRSGYSIACSAICRSCVNMISDLFVSLIFHSDKSLCPASPSLQWVLWVSVPHLLGLRYYDPLRLPLLRLGSLRISLAYQYLAFFLFRLCSSRLAFRVRKYTPERLASLLYRFAMPGALRKEIAVLSSSQVTPLCTCPARRPRWCPFNLPYRFKDYCLPSHQERRLSPAGARLSSRTTTIPFSGLSHAAYTLATPGFTHTLLAMHAGSLQLQWLTLTGGNCTDLQHSPTE